MDKNMSITDRLFALQDLEYREFQSKLMPTVDKDRIIGVRTPKLRALARELAGTEQAEDFMNRLPHEYYDQDNLHGFLIERQKDFNRTIELIERFLPYVDNWATCDIISPAVFKKHLPELLPRIKNWLKSDRTYTVRFGIGMLMRYYLDGEFKDEYAQMVSQVRSGEYYINMMAAWYFATALAKQYDAAAPYFEQRKLDKWVHNKAIQKAVESYRVKPEHKQYLRTLKLAKSSDDAENNSTAGVKKCTNRSRI